MTSLWTQNVKETEFPSLDKSIKTDVLVIGGGLTGVLCAHMLGHAGVEYTLVEANRIGSGVTKNTTAKLTFFHGLIYDKLIKKASFDKAQQYLQINRRALSYYDELCKIIDCDYEKKTSFVYAINNRSSLEREAVALRRLGIEPVMATKTPLPFEVAGALGIEGQAQFHPLKFLYKIAENLTIYEKTMITKVSGNVAFFDKGEIIAKKIIFASHFPFADSHGAYFLKMYQHRSYAIALETDSLINNMYVDEVEKGMSFRRYNGALFIGGGDHRTGKRGGGYRELRSFAKRHFPNAKEKACWATQDCMTLDGVPYIGRYSKATPNWLVATGFNKWGMTSAMVSAMILSDLAAEKPNEYSDVFSPSRSIIKPQLLLNGAEAVINLLTPTVRRCTHLGCALKWNKAEKTWDCPCHGSRFDSEGHIVDNPATKNAKV